MGSRAGQPHQVRKPCLDEHFGVAGCRQVADHRSQQLLYGLRRRVDGTTQPHGHLWRRLASRGRRGRQFGPQAGQAVRGHHIQQHTLRPPRSHAYRRRPECSHGQRTAHGVQPQAVTPAAGQLAAEINLVAGQQAPHNLRGFIQVAGGAAARAAVPLLDNHGTGCAQRQCDLAASQRRYRCDPHGHGHRRSHRYGQWADTQGDLPGMATHRGGQGKGVERRHFTDPQLRVTQPVSIDGHLHVFTGGTVLPQGSHYTELHRNRLRCRLNSSAGTLRLFVGG